MFRVDSMVKKIMFRVLSGLLPLVTVLFSKAFHTIEQFLGYQAEMGHILRFGVVGIVGIGAQLYLVNGICSGELFPTSIRNLSFSFGQFHTRVGVVLAPQIFFLVSEIGEYKLWVPKKFRSF